MAHIRQQEGREMLPSKSWEQVIRDENPYGDFEIRTSSAPISQLQEGQTVVRDDSEWKSFGTARARNASTPLVYEGTGALEQEIRDEIAAGPGSGRGVWLRGSAGDLHLSKVVRIPYTTNVAVEDANGNIVLKDGQPVMRTEHLIIGYEGWIT